MTHHELLETLGGTPDRVKSLAHGLSPTRLTRRPREGEWSMTEILTHLLLGERDVIFPRLQRMLLEGAPTFPSSATGRTGFARRPRCGTSARISTPSARCEARTIAFLKSLGQHDWRRIGTTPTRGTLTIEDYARYLADHDLEHLSQLEATRAVIVG